MRTVGIVIAKENSNRFPGKNYHEYKNKPLFLHAVDMMLECPLIERVYVGTDSEAIKKICNYLAIDVKYRGPNINRDYQTYLSVLRYVYQAIDRKYDLICSVMANSVGHDKRTLHKALHMMSDNPSLFECRSVDESGFENGIFVFTETVILNSPCISSHVGIVTGPGREIHYESELEHE